MRYVCTGFVHPERANVLFERCELKSKDWNAVVSCDASQITVVLDVPTDVGRIAAFIARDIAGNVEVVAGLLSGRALARAPLGGGFPALPFRLQGGVTVPP